MTHSKAASGYQSTVSHCLQTLVYCRLVALNPTPAFPPRAMKQCPTLPVEGAEGTLRKKQIYISCYCIFREGGNLTTLVYRDCTALGDLVVHSGTGDHVPALDKPDTFSCSSNHIPPSCLHLGRCLLPGVPADQCHQDQPDSLPP